jgi:uncharacterized protein (TIGR02246 family)
MPAVAQLLLVRCWSLKLCLISEKTVKRALQSLALFLALVSFSASGQTVRNESTALNREQDEKAIKQVLTDFVNAWNRHDAKAFSMVFAEDADFTNVRGMSAHGRTEIEKFHAPRFATNLKDSNQKMIETKVRFITPDVAAVDARWEMTGAKRYTDGQEIPLRKGLLNFVMTRQAGQWLITVMHNLDLTHE